MPSINYNIRLEQDLRNRAFAVFESYGLSPSQAIKLFLTQVADTHTIPLSFEHKANQEKIPNMATLAAIQEAKAGNLKGYASLDAMMDEIKQCD
ncbi:type II toxin-antitoxin system RelB/DinJ family antitoxin [Conchiformibius steedae]|uniref:type II toxin-antitoxin system RelB/DinJ family antitoxin n=1 Tax=Conchiformibius steedae TaxID=153493 RepID=UPI0015F48555|nr:type II toxin-antitoxin system RelB/DinJ family antitoxin [Conchiformibius steedae]QMT32580.1 type II toxin-antitoxin system RelB/DinJ family antitoxin [Conchiformibius steedae]